MVIVTIVNSITETSMPVNEFAVYRAKNDYPTIEILLVCDKVKNSIIDIPEKLKVYYINNCIKKMRSVIKQLIKKYDKNIVFHIHHERAAVLFYLASLFLDVRKYSLYTVHSTYSDRNFKYKLLSFSATLFSRYITCVSMTAYDNYNFFIKKIKKERMCCIVNGVDTDRIDLYKKKVFDDRSRKKIFYIARMIPLKNHSFLLSLIRELKDYKLVLIGKEDADRKIRSLAKTLNVYDRVEFTGTLKRNEVYYFLEPGAFYISPSKVEGLPVSVLEAMRCGLIPILSNINPHKEIANAIKEINVLDYDINKWVISVYDYQKMDSKNIMQLSETISTKVKERFSLYKMHEKYISLYNKIINNEKHK